MYRYIYFVGKILNCFCHFNIRTCGRSHVGTWKSIDILCAWPVIFFIYLFTWRFSLSCITGKTSYKFTSCHCGYVLETITIETVKRTYIWYKAARILPNYAVSVPLQNLNSIKSNYNHRLIVNPALRLSIRTQWELISMFNYWTSAVLT